MSMGCTIAGLDLAGPAGALRETAQSSKVADLVPYTTNALAPAELTSSALTTATLDAASAAAMGASPEARIVLAYAVGCALETTQTISFTVEGVTFRDGGGIGIAPGWT